jgi:hypothetical protein
LQDYQDEKGDISILGRRGHFYFGLTEILGHIAFSFQTVIVNRTA